MISPATSPLPEPSISLNAEAYDALLQEGSEGAPKMAPTAPKAAALLDLRGTPCPINFVKAKLRLQSLSPGNVLEIWLDAGEPIEQVPHSLSIAGYEIVTELAQAEFHILHVRCPS